MTPSRVFIVWAMASASALIPILGQLLLGFGLVWLIVAVLLAWLLAIIHTNAMNLCPSTVDLLVAADTLLAARRWEQPVGTLVLGILSTLRAVAGILTHISSFINSIGDALFPFTFVMLVDWLVVQRRTTPVGEFFESPRTLSGWLALPPGLAFAVGCAFSIWFHPIAPAWFNDQISAPLAGALISAAIYAAIAAAAPGFVRSEAAPAPVPAAGSAS